jgi:hypothetical protein
MKRARGWMAKPAWTAILLAIAAPGCGDPEGETRSPSADTDPSKYERAITEAAQAEQESRAAEANALGGALDGLEGR